MIALKMSKQIYAININLSKFENNQIWQVAKSATASHLNLWERNAILKIWPILRKCAILHKRCEFYASYGKILMIRKS